MTRVRTLGSRALRAERSMPPWARYTLLFGQGGLGIAFVGFYLDVAQHIDRGRDTFLFTPAHTMIVIGLLSIVGSAVLATLLYDGEGRPGPGAVRLAGRWVPAGALYLGACGMVALAGFPLDDIWHRLFGKDVTLWGPTHLMMIGGASLSPLGYWMLVKQAVAEAPGPVAWRWHLGRALAAVLTGLSTFQGEFDFGVPQFRLLYHPVLIALAAAAGLTIARSVLGRGGALRAAAGFIVLRGLLAAALGGLGYTVPHFPLYLAEALLVEAVAARWSLRRGLRGPVAAGLVVGTIGFAAEYAWSHVWMPFPWTPAVVVPGVVLGTLAAVAGAILGSEIGRRVAPDGSAPEAARAGSGPEAALAGPGPEAALAVRPLPRGVVALAGLGIAAALVIPYPRGAARGIAADVTLDTTTGPALVTARVRPAGAVRDADWFDVLAYQGGGRVIAPMHRVAPGEWRTERRVPLDGTWKVSLRLARGAEMSAIPIRFPYEPETGKPPIAAQEAKTEEFGSDAALLLREAREDAPGWAPGVAYGAVAVALAAWITAAAYAFGRLRRHRPSAGRATSPTAAGSRSVSSG